MAETQSQVEQRLRNLETHLEKENPILRDAVRTFQELDKIAYRLGLLHSDQSYAMRLSWWPMISLMGTFSAGKSSFINTYLGKKVQRTGTQAVDDKFTVINYSENQEVSTLPGTALDADPRFPFYQISDNIQEIVAAGAQRIDVYLQLKTCNSEKLRGKILIDSPGFDADNQRTAVLKIIKHIIDLSDLVLVLFDARHPEPGAMQDTLHHLVEDTINRSDSNKFLYILNQIDVTAREDNPEEVFGSWQRALSSKGLTAGRFYRIYNPEAAMPIDNPTIRERFESKLKEDLGDILQRMDQVGIQRAYRVVGMLEQTARDIEMRIVPQLQKWIERWRSWTFWIDIATVSTLFISVLIFWGITGLSPIPTDPIWKSIAAVGIAGASVFLHLKIAEFTAHYLRKKIAQEVTNDFQAECLQRGFDLNTHFGRRLLMPILSSTPIGWGNHLKQQLEKVIQQGNSYVQKLNDRFTLARNPSSQD